MENIYFTADTHFGHANVIKFCNRPFKDIQEMDEMLIKNWNETVGAEDTIYILGDFAWRDIRKYLDRLNGNKHLVKGSHDKQVSDPSKLFVSVSDIAGIVIEGQPIVMCHYAMRVWRASHYGSWQLYGHSHGRLPPQGKQMDVGVDCNNYKPVSLDEVKVYMSQQPENFNKVDKEYKLSDEGFKEKE